ncbi:hypothetical protein H6F39_17045 [Anabaena sp. FACHB-1250]|uniref:hypothetical protein n=1 Tax=Anabaena sp. FACHB-1250 TaxID=2692770 RepID=UPI0016813C59|nr:hypothetical protein [Anabaena sp. FACHB-1250]MBD2143019.1 hypothetical protein [Anabaena sp. FACHB-1250]
MTLFDQGLTTLVVYPDFITEIDYEKRFGGNGKSDFTLTANSLIGVEVKSRHGSIDRVRWSVSADILK